MPSASTITIVPGQGVYLPELGNYLTEYPADKEVYVEHVLNTPNRARAIGAKLVIASGGPTNRGAQGRTEGEGMQQLLEDFRAAFSFECAAETRALDSGENVLFSLMEARRGLPSNIAIGQIWVWSAWRFKRERFILTARALGIADQFYFSAFASEPAAGPKAIAGEREVVDYMSASGDFLLFGPSFEEKRSRRYAGRGPYQTRLDGLVQEFPGVFEAIDGLKQVFALRNTLDFADFAPLQAAVRDEILIPAEL